MQLADKHSEKQRPQSCLTSDVLAGAAIGHWIGSFMSLYFFENSPFALSADSMKSGYILQVRFLWH